MVASFGGGTICDDACDPIGRVCTRAGGSASDAYASAVLVVATGSALAVLYGASPVTNAGRFAPGCVAPRQYPRLSKGLLPSEAVTKVCFGTVGTADATTTACGRAVGSGTMCSTLTGFAFGAVTLATVTGARVCFGAGSSLISSVSFPRPNSR